MELMRKRSLREGFVFVGSGVMMYVKVMGNSTIVPDTLYFTVSKITGWAYTTPVSH